MSSGDNNKDSNLRRGSIEVEKAERIEVAEDTRIRSIGEHLYERKRGKGYFASPLFFSKVRLERQVGQRSNCRP